MSAVATALPSRGSGLQVMLRIVWRTRWRGAVVWVLALAATMAFTAVAVAGLYDTPSKIHSYATAVTSGNALQAINGHVEGIDSLGGVIQDEFGFLASFLLPLLGVSLVARASRREEEIGPARDRPRRAGSRATTLPWPPWHSRREQSWPPGSCSLRG